MFRVFDYIYISSKTATLKNILYFIIAFSCVTAHSQPLSEIAPPYNIKTVSFVQNAQNVIPVFAMNESFQLKFDDLFGNEANYYYEIVHCDYDWKPSQLVKSEYLAGFDNLRIQQYVNSFNTLQIYSHYSVSIPNQQTQLRVSGNYIIKILDESRDVVFTRKFILFEDLVSVPMQIKRPRTMDIINEKHNIDFAVKSPTLLFQNPLQNVKILLMQNGRFDNAIKNIKPQYTIGNDLIYKYDKETQFWAGNEFNYFENKDLRAANNNVARVDLTGAVYNSHLYTNEARANSGYTFFPDINGNFVPTNINAENNYIEADYAWVFFTLSAPSFYQNKNIYINGMFNNYALSDEYKMDYNAKTSRYEKAIMIKQGFVNYQFVVADKSGRLDEKNAIDGNYSQTENEYTALVYYRENNQRYDRVIGRGMASSVNITN